MIPGVDRALLLVHLALEIAQRADIVERMDIAGDDLRQRPHLRARDRILRQQRRLGMGLVEIFDDGERLDQHLACRRDQRRHAHLRIDRAEFRPPVVAAVLDQMDRHGLVGDALEIERDAHAVGGRRAEIGIELHASILRTIDTSRVVVFERPTSATSSADRAVNCFERAIERLAVARRQDVGQAAWRNSSACGATSSYMVRPAAVSDRNASRMSSRLARRASSRRFSRSATARDTLVLCMWVCAPIALAGHDARTGRA